MNKSDVYYNNSARCKLDAILDENSFEELCSKIHTYNFSGFIGYDEKLRTARDTSGEMESVIIGVGTISGCKCVIAIFEPMYMLGSMGLVAGEKITYAFDLATHRKLPIITITSSCGARIQEGVVSLAQMAKTSAAVYKHAKRNLLYISVVSDPTLGGVTASFASLADIIVGEKGARFGFAGRRIIEESTHEILTEDFQTVEYGKQHGMVDIVVDRTEIKKILRQLVTLHTRQKRTLWK